MAVCLCVSIRVKSKGQIFDRRYVVLSVVANPFAAEAVKEWSLVIQLKVRLRVEQVLGLYVFYHGESEARNHRQ